MIFKLITKNKYIINIINDIPSLDNEELIGKYIKKLIIKIMDIYKTKLTGLYQVNIFENFNYGLIIEINQIDDYSDLICNIVDLKLNIYKDADFLVKSSDPFIFESDMYYFNEEYYANIEDVNIDKLIEHVDIIHGKETEKILEQATKITKIMA